MRAGAFVAPLRSTPPEGQMSLLPRCRAPRAPSLFHALSALLLTLAASGFSPTTHAASHDTAQAWSRIVQAGDHRGLPFAIVDKREAVLSVFDGHGREIARTPVLLGLAPGDHTTPGVGERAQVGAVAPQERTTPAGRFEAEPGRNTQGEDIVWLDYEAAFAIHRLRPGPARQAREQRLASPRQQDRRVSLGCVVVPVAFYREVIAPHLGRSRSVVYVLPETRPLDTLFQAAGSPHMAPAVRTASR